MLRRLGSFPASFAVFTLSNGSVLVSRSYNNSICMLQPGGACITVAGAPNNITFGANGIVNGSFAGDNGPAASARLWFPTGGVGDPLNPARFWFCDTYNNRVSGECGAQCCQGISSWQAPGCTGFLSCDASAASAGAHGVQWHHHHIRRQRHQGLWRQWPERHSGIAERALRAGPRRPQPVHRRAGGQQGQARGHSDWHHQHCGRP